MTGIVPSNQPSNSGKRWVIIGIATVIVLGGGMVAVSFSTSNLHTARFHSEFANPYDDALAKLRNVPPPPI